MSKWKYTLLGSLILLVLIFSSCGKKAPDPVIEDVPKETPVAVQIPVQATPEPEPTPSPQPEVINPSPLTGLEMEGEYKPVAIMVENFAAARPHSGVIGADIVYEAHAEGGITRFLALYLSQSPEVIGPVRSLRHYFLWMAREWDAYLVHYGQSFIAENMFNKIAVKRLNGLVTDKPFWRDHTRKAPHNVYIKAEASRDRIDFTQKAQGFKFSKDAGQGGQAYETVTIPYNRSNNVVSYRYDTDQEQNMRFINTKADTDRESGKQLFAKNIIIQYTKHSVLEPGAGYREIELIGSGKSLYLIGGQAFHGTWTRRDQDARTIFVNEKGEEITLRPGNTWIQIVQEDMAITME